MSKENNDQAAARARIMAKLEDQQKKDAIEDAKRESGGRDFVYLSFNLGETKRIRLLPPIQGLAEVDPFKLFWFHWGVGPASKERVTCPKHYGEPTECPVCEVSDRLRKSEDDATKKSGQQIKGKQRAIWQAIERGSSESAQLWEISYTTFKLIRSLLLKPYIGLDLVSVESGFDLEVTRSLKKQDINPYSIELIMHEGENGLVADKCPLSEDAAEVNKWLESRYDLTKYMSYEYTYEQLERILEEGISPRALRKELYEAQKAEKEDPAGDSANKRQKV